MRVCISGAGSATASEPAAGRSADPRTHRVPRLHSKQNPGERTMNLMELQHALRQLRLAGIATVLETPFRQAPSETPAPIHLISALAPSNPTRPSSLSPM